MLRRSIALSVFTLVLVQIVACAAQEQTPPPRIFVLAADQNVSMTSSPEVNQALGAILPEVFSRVAQPNCDFRDENWIGGVVKGISDRGLGDIDWTCPSTFEFDVDSSIVFPAYRTLALETARTVSPFAKEAFGTEEVFPLTGFVFNYPFDGQVCQLEALTLLHVQGRWALQNAGTNAPIQESQADYRRQYLSIINTLILNGSSVTMEGVNIPLTIRGETGNMEHSKWAGTAGLSLANPSYDNGQTTASLRERNSRSVDALRDTLLPSNIAILALPMAGNLVPSSALRLTTWKSLVFFIILTDFLTTLPFIIKGVELVVQARKVAATTLVFHMGRPGDVQYVDVFSQSCSLQTSSFAAGWVFISFGVGLLLLGTCLDIGTHKRDSVKRMKRRLSSRLRKSQSMSALQEELDLECRSDDSLDGTGHDKDL